MKKYLFLVVLVCLTVVSVVSAADEKFTIGYTNLADSDVFCVSRKNALIELTKDRDDIEIKFADANNDIQKQLDQVDNFIAQGVDLLVLVPVDYAGITPAVEKANAAGIPVICLGIKSEGGEYIFVGSENYDSGHIQGELFAKILPENAKYLYLAGTAGLSHSTDRRNGFEAALKEAGRDDVEKLADMDGDYTRDKAMRITEDWIQSFPEFDAIVAANDQMALGAVEALKAANRTEGVLITGIDGVTEACQAIKDGYMVQSVLQDAPGQAAACLKVIDRIIAGEETEAEYIVPFQSITIDNLDEFLK